MPAPLSSNLAGFKRRHVYMGMGAAALVFSVTTAAPVDNSPDTDAPVVAVLQHQAIVSTMQHQPIVAVIQKSGAGI